MKLKSQLIDNWNLRKRNININIIINNLELVNIVSKYVAFI